MICNFIMSHGGCEVMALPSLIFRRRYVVYCPWNLIDLAEKVTEDSRAKSLATSADRGRRQIPKCRKLGA